MENTTASSAIDSSKLPILAMEVITTEEISRSESLFEELKQLRMQLTGNFSTAESENIDNSFKMHITNVMTKLDTRLKVLSYFSSFFEFQF